MPLPGGRYGSDPAACAESPSPRRASLLKKSMKQTQDQSRSGPHVSLESTTDGIVKEHRPDYGCFEKFHSDSFSSGQSTVRTGRFFEVFQRSSTECGVQGNMLRIAHPPLPLEEGLTPAAHIQELGSKSISSALLHLVELTKYAHQVFEGLLYESKYTFSRVADISDRINRVRQVLPSLETGMYTAPEKTAFFLRMGKQMNSGCATHMRLGHEFRPDIPQASDLFDHKVEDGTFPGLPTAISEVMMCNCQLDSFP